MLLSLKGECRKEMTLLSIDCLPSEMLTLLLRLVSLPNGGAC